MTSLKLLEMLKIKKIMHMNNLGLEKKTGLNLIAEERQRQIEKEGWTPEHDDEHTNNELANAAATYAMDSDCRDALMNIYDCKLTGIPPTWPWDEKWYKPTPDDRIKELVKAGALIAAEIDRLLRNEEKESRQPS